MVNKPLSINLLKKKNGDFVDKFIHWALTIGRFVIILTETVALITFLYRFNLDRQLVDLHDAIKQKLAVVNVLKNNETTYRNLQDRIAFASQNQDIGTQTTKNFLDVISQAPPDLLYNNVVLTGDRIHMETNVQSVQSLTKFIDKLKNHSAVKTVLLDQVENKTSTGNIKASITVTLKTTTPKNSAKKKT